MVRKLFLPETIRARSLSCHLLWKLKEDQVNYYKGLILDVTIKLETEEDIKKLKENVMVIKEGVEYRLKVTFKIQV